jgi:EAL domain-containing protein (putative c-di-GMP-specific phosphodiesterase class I)
LLIAISDRLRLQFRDTDTVARIGVDEFAIILNETARENASSVANVINEILTAPYVIEGNTITINISIGISGYPEDSDRAQQLLQYANIAMKYAKRKHHGFAYYDAQNDEHNINKLALTKDLRSALEDNLLELYYQPQIDVKAKEVSGAEALLRWKHPLHGFVRPDKIIDLAEQSGFINELTFWVIDNAFQNCKKWHDKGYELNVSINLAVQNLNYPNLAKKIQSYLNKHDLNPSNVLFEITENGMMTNPGRSIEILNQLHEIGLKLSIDDFGTGFSSLSYLQKLPVDEVKIDKSFVMNMDKNKGNRAIVESVIDLGHNLGLRVVAEGIETNKVLFSLSKLYCDIAQGYLLSKPLPSKDFEKWLKDNKHYKSDLFFEKNNISPNVISLALT